MMRFHGKSLLIVLGFASALLAFGVVQDAQAKEAVLFTDRGPTSDEILAILTGKTETVQDSVGKYIIEIEETKPESASGPSAPVASAQPVRLQRVERPEGRSLSVNIEFELGSAEVLPDYDDEIAQFAEAMLKDESLNIIIIGHADATGDDAFNLELSELRARNVLQNLVITYNIDEDRLEAIGLGEKDLLFPNAPFDGRNRRVEFLRPAS